VPAHKKDDEDQAIGRSCRRFAGRRAQSAGMPASIRPCSEV